MKRRKRRLKGRAYRHAETLADYLCDPFTEKKDRETLGKAFFYLSHVTGIAQPPPGVTPTHWRDVRDSYITMRRLVMDACDDAMELDEGERSDLKPDSIMGRIYHTAQFVAQL
jgi:hypothetical protein